MPETSRLFSTAYARLVSAASTSGEPPRPVYTVEPGGATVSERLLQCIWFDQLVRPEALHATDGRRVHVRAPGFWNFEAGPDFFNAEIRFDDEPVQRGDVEIHLRPGDWRAHGHADDPRYNDTILHVVLRNPGGEPTVSTAAGGGVPQLELAPALSAELDILRASLDIEEYPHASPSGTGACCRAGLTGDADAFWDLVGLAGDARLLLKAERAAALGTDWDQVCYAMVLQALGYKAFAHSCRALAQRAPFAVLQAAAARERDSALAFEAMLLGMAGLLPDARAAFPDDTAAARTHTLRELWAKTRSRFDAEPLTPEDWRAPHVRPANRPARRLVAAARLLSAWGPPGPLRALQALLRRDSPPRQAWRALEGALTVEPDAFWGTRGDLARPPWPRPLRLVGPARARVLAIDAAAPALLAWARAAGDTALERSLHDALAAAPAQGMNAKLRLALRRMMGAADRWPPARRTALHGQGLLHLLQEWCIERPSCEGCAILRILEEGPPGPQKQKGRGTHEPRRDDGRYPARDDVREC